MTKRKSTVLCDAVTAKDNRGAVVCKIQLAEGKAPEWLMLFPTPDASGNIQCRDGRTYLMTKQSEIVSAFNAEAHPIAFDKDHGVERVGWGGGDGAAIGWIEELQERAGAIWCRVEWTSEGRELVESKKYRYVSPAFTITSELINSVEKLRISAPTSAGLTNRPAMVMPALTNVQPQKAATMNEALLKKLGLPKDATQEQIDAAVEKLATDKEAVKVEAEAASVKHKAELAAAQAKIPALADFVPRADHDAAIARVAAIETAAAAEKAAAHNKEAASEIASAKAAGKIAPASEAFYASTCSTPAGLASFREFVKTAPVIAPDNIVKASASIVNPELTIAGLTAEQIQIASALGQTPEKYLAALKN